MIKLFTVALLGLVLTGCASTRVEERREASTGMSDQEAIVLLGRASYSDRETETSLQIALRQLWPRANARSG